MDIVHADRYTRAIVVGVTLALLAFGASACGESDEPEGVNMVQVSKDPCVQSFGSGVQSVGMSADGMLMYLSNRRPNNLPEDAAWYSEDLAVYVIRDTAGAEGGEAITESYAVAIVMPWETPESDVIPGVQVDDFGRPEEGDPAIFPEQMIDLQLARTGHRFVLSVGRGSTTEGLAKLYTGLVPPDDRVLAPGDGLEVVRVNRFEATEGVNTYMLSPDGTKLATTVGPLGELRIYDFAAEQPIVYTAGPEGNTVVSNDFPDPAINLSVQRRPAISLPGATRMAWSPDGDALAVSHADSVGVTGVWLVDLATGDYELVRSFRQSTTPFVQWSSDGQSLFVLTTRLTSSSGSSFGNSEIRRIAAREGGADIGDAWQLSQQPWYTTAPADFTAYGDDSRFVLSWEGQFWLLETPSSGSGSAAYGPITDQPPAITAMAGNLTGRISIAPTMDTIAFRAVIGNSYQVGQRLYASAPSCPLAAPAPAADEGDAVGEPAEGEAAAGDATDEQPVGEGEGDAGGETQGEATPEG